MQLDETLAASRTMKGPLGAAAFVVLQGLAQSGAPAEQVAAVAKTLHQWLPKLPSADAEILLQVLSHRVAEAQDADAFDDMIRLGGRLTLVEAHILADTLNQQGVFSRLNHEHLSAADLPYPNTDVEVWVRASDHEQAQAICESVSATDDSVQACPSCGEESPAHFAYCWACGGAMAAPG